MTTSKNNNQSQEDHVLAQLYKEGAKDEPPAKLNDEIINYAANANKADSKSSQVSSHFGGGWKVPLSMAASVVVVFALLVQLDQSPQQLELPPIPEISIPAESKDNLFKSKTSSMDSNAEESMANDAPTMKRETNPLGTNAGNVIDLKAKQKPNINNVPSTTSTIEEEGEEKQQPSRDRLMLEESLDHSSRADDVRTEDDSRQGLSAPPSLDTREPKSTALPTAKKQMQKSDHDAFTSSSKPLPSEAIQQRSTINKSATHNIDNTGAVSDIAPEAPSESEQEYAPISVEDWLLMIERLVARKDYAEAARQLEKFKHAHPKVNVEDLDAKIP